jgi:hypothetical protein
VEAKRIEAGFEHSILAKELAQRPPAGYPLATRWLPAGYPLATRWLNLLGVVSLQSRDGLAEAGGSQSCNSTLDQAHLSAIALFGYKAVRVLNINEREETALHCMRPESTSRPKPGPNKCMCMSASYQIEPLLERKM